jgi:predicted HTH transcriptional regulator
MVEHLGSGMGRILKTYDPSIFQFEDEFLMVNFPFAEGFSLPIGNENGNDVGNEKSDKILKRITQDPRIKLDEIVAQTGISKRTVSREMKKMQEDGLLKRVGSARSGHWEIVEG